MQKKKKHVSYDCEFYCDICEKLLNNPNNYENYELLEGKNGGGPDNYKYHIHINCLLLFWKKNAK